MRISGPHRANQDNLHTGEDQPFSSFRRIDILPPPPLQQWQGKDGQVSFLRPPSASPPTLPLLGLFLNHPDTEGISHYALYRGDPELCHPCPWPRGPAEESSASGPSRHVQEQSRIPAFTWSLVLWVLFFCANSAIVRRVLYKVTAS